MDRLYCTSMETRPIPQSTEWFIEDQAYSASYDLTLSHPLPPFPRHSTTGDTQEDWEIETTYWRERRDGVREEPNHTTARKPGNLFIIQYSLFYINRTYCYWILIYWSMNLILIMRDLLAYVVGIPLVVLGMAACSLSRVRVRPTVPVCKINCKLFEWLFL
jgi:hypothetical protein